MAADVCEEAGKPFFYSTKGALQSVALHNGVRLSGAMTEGDLQTFCQENNIRCIIDAAHPFAENLHRTVASATLPVIRVQRDFPPHIPEVTYCKDYDDAIMRMKQDGVKSLLALSGANTIARLKGFWTEVPTKFRILNRPESMALAREHGLRYDQLVFYDKNLPSLEEEKALICNSHCDAIITKESGESGGFDAKVQAALALGVKVYVVERPTLPRTWHYVTGRHSLRREIERLVPDFFPLRTGLTTGACATAAVKAAMLSLLYNECEEEVTFALPDGETICIPVCNDARGIATVTKEQNDDPDVTKGCRITAKVEYGTDGIRFLQGEGVGRVTLPGLGIAVGEPAINPTPRMMICSEIRSLTDRDIDVTISVEGGRALASKTFNHKVGVVDGISIIGTSGIVKPLSNEAFVQSIRREMQVAMAIGCTEIGLVAGMKSETALRRERDIRCIHYGNFIGEALKAARDMGFESVTLSIMIGKAVKLAEGHLDTHSHKVAMNKDFLCAVASKAGIDASPIAAITMARELWDVMPPAFFDVIVSHCYKHCREIFPNVNIVLSR